MKTKRKRIKAIKVASTLDYMYPVEIFCKMLNLKRKLLNQVI